MKSSDLSKMTRQQLQNLARRKKITVSSSLLKGELVSKIGRELRKQEKQKAAGGKGAGKGAAAKTSGSKKAATRKAGSAKPATKNTGSSASSRTPATKKKAATQQTTTKKAGRAVTKPKAQVKTKKKTAAKATTKPTAKTKKATPKTGKARTRAQTPTKSTAKAVKAKTRKSATPSPVRKTRAATGARKRPTATKRVKPAHAVDEELTAKFVLGPAAMQDESGHEARMDLPAGYGDHRLVMMVRDPYWVYCYWELQPQYIEEALSRLGRQTHEVRWVLRVQLQGGQAGTGYFDTEVDTRARSWYLHLAPPGATFTAEIGIRDSDGRFAAVARSNSVTLPMDRPSSNMDEQWMLSDEELHHHYAGMEFPHAEGMKPTGKGSLFEEGQSGRPVQPGGASEYRPPSSSKK